MQPNEAWKPTIRFKERDLALIAASASRERMMLSSWIREAALTRAELVLEGDGDVILPPLVYETAHGFGKPISIRFSAQEARRLRRAAAKEGALPSAWVRAVAVQRMMESKGKVNESKRTAAPQRKRQQNRSAARMSVVGRARRQAPAGS